MLLPGFAILIGLVALGATHPILAIVIGVALYALFTTC
jgi:hypothetical protein